MVAKTATKKSVKKGAGEKKPATGIEKLTKRIMERAEEETKKIIKEGEKESAEIIKKANEKADAIEKVILDEGRAKANIEKKKIVADATVRGRKMRLEIREDAIKEVLESAQNRLIEIAEGKKYAKVLEDLVVGSCYDIGGGKAELFVREKDKKLVEKMLSKIVGRVKKEHGLDVKLEISKTPIDSPGVLVRAQGGMVEIDNTFSTRLERMRPSLRASIAKMLFSG